jgi:hypothetical protein
MNIKWEKNSRVNRLLAESKISENDVIARCKTDEFPPEMATVRIQRLKDKTPSVTIHIRGKSKKQKLWNGYAYEGANTCRVNIANDWKTGTMSSNGELDEDYNWQDVHDVVTRVKEAMEMN